jgi:exosortase
VTDFPRKILERRSLATPWLDFILLLLTGVIALHPLALYWENNPDYAFGWGVPVLAAYLFHERWLRRPAPQPPGTFVKKLRHPELVEGSALPEVRGSRENPCPTNSSLSFLLLAWAVAVFLSRLLEETVPDWRPALWLGAILYVSGLLGWCWLSGGIAWLRHFLFPIAFLLCAIPWLYNLEQPIVQGLMRANSIVVADSLLLCDIPAQAAGNTLLLSTGQLGVEEACSGIRSLQAIVMISLFLGEFYHLTLKRRTLFCALGIFFALLGNYLRLLFLAWHAARDGLAAVSALHDSAGIVIFAATVLGLWLIHFIFPKAPAYLAEQKSDPTPPFAAWSPWPRPATRWAAGLLVAALLTETATQGWFAWRESTAPHLAAWIVSPPASAQAIPISDSTHELLHDTEARTGAWTDPQGWRWRLLWFRYAPQAANRIAFAAHNPEVCLAGAGWRETRDYGGRTWSARGISLPIHAYLFSAGSTSAYVFWIARTDREVLPKSKFVFGQRPNAFVQRLLSWSRDAWLGIRNSGARSLEVVLSGPPNYSAARRACLGFLGESLVTSQPPVP